MSTTSDLAKLAAFPAAVLSWVDGERYPVNVAVAPDVEAKGGIVRFAAPAGLAVPAGAVVAVTGSHIRPGPAGGFDERSHVTAWGVATSPGRGKLAVAVDRTWSWDERDLPLPAAYERDVPKARRYFEALSAERGERIRPRLAPGWLLFRATRAPFLSATFAPVLLGIAVAARAGSFDLTSALITVVAATFIHLGLNVANDVFDTLQGADDANATPTKFSGGSRVLQNALISMRGMSLLSFGCYAVALALGLVLLAMRGSTALVVIAAVGFVISLAYTMPPFKLVYRGLGEIATAIGFGPVMLLGAYTVQTRGSLSWEAALASVPVALLVALILYVNEIPDREGDAKAGKRTLPVRWSAAAVIRGWDLAAALTFLAVLGGVAGGLLPVPALLILLAVPLARRVHAGLVRFYDSPYALMATMGANIQLHAIVGVLLIAAYLASMAAQSWLRLRPYLW
jgi:1,4-dihydroxy-2-naphthoate octaprenyltransferase